MTSTPRVGLRREQALGAERHYHRDACEFTVSVFGWSTARPFVVVRQRVRATRAAVRRTLLDVPG